VIFCRTYVQIITTYEQELGLQLERYNEETNMNNPRDKVAMDAKYVILGSSGNTGSIIADFLLSKGQKVRVVGRDLARLRRFVRKGAEAYAADLSDAAALTRAFSGARAAYLLLPPLNSREEQERQSGAIAAAMKNSGLRYAVHLSSYGAHVPKGTGSVTGLHSSEQKLNAISDLNVMHLRPGYFMENNLAAVDMIHGTGMIGHALMPLLKLPLIATILRAEIDRSYEEFLEVFEKFYADDVEVSSEDSPEIIRGKEKVHSFLLNFLVPLHVMTEIAGLSMSVQLTQVPRDGAHETHSEWRMDFTGVGESRCTFKWYAIRRWAASMVVYEHHYGHEQIDGPLTQDDLNVKWGRSEIGIQSPS
jgi:NAD(P)H-binding